MSLTLQYRLWMWALWHESHCGLAFLPSGKVAVLNEANETNTNRLTSGQSDHNGKTF